MNDQKCLGCGSGDLDVSTYTRDIKNPLDKVTMFECSYCDAVYPVDDALIDKVIEKERAALDSFGIECIGGNDLFLHKIVNRLGFILFLRDGKNSFLNWKIRVRALTSILLEEVDKVKR